MEMIEDNKVNIEWEPFTLPNINIYRTKLPQAAIDRLWTYIDKAKNNVNFELAGNISESLSLVDEDDHFFKYVVRPIARVYLSTTQVSWTIRTTTEDYSGLKMDRFWVNFQNKHEFNPGHVHSGLISFVIWMKIPTHYKDQHQLDFCKHSNTPSASDFEFSYSTILGNQQDYRINMSPELEGHMVVFPSKLKHQVYPFYDCDEQRVSISGNVCWDSHSIISKS